jgi:hypothetical protein
MHMLVTTLSYVWLVVLILMLCLFAGLLIGGTVFGVRDLRVLLRRLKRQHEEGLEDASDEVDSAAHGGSPT